MKCVWLVAKTLKLSCVKEEDELEWDDDCRVGTGEQLELEVGVREEEAGVRNIEAFCESAEKDEEEGEEDGIET